MTAKSTNSKPEVHLRPALPAEASSLAALAMRAHKGDRFFLLLFPNHTTSSLHYRSSELFFEASNHSRILDSNQYVVVAELDGKVAGYASFNPSWHRECIEEWQPGNLAVQRLERWCVQTIGRVKDWAGYGTMNLPGIDAAFSTEFLKFRAPRLERICGREFVASGGRHWNVAAIRVHPEFQRRGVGRVLMEWGKNMATSDGVGMVVESTEAGSGLYASVGFREVERWEEIGNTRVMVWTPED
jgi:GNAT superfamily N-acetyltransferase